MNANSDMIKLYSARILSLAGNIGLTEPIEDPDGTASRRSPLCGSNVSVSIKLNGDKISEFYQDVKACALGQASASLFANIVIGLGRETVERGRDELFEMLTNGGPIPTAPFDEFALLEPAKEYRNRHASILLTLNATLDAMDEIAEKKRAI